MSSDKQIPLKVRRYRLWIDGRRRDLCGEMAPGPAKVRMRERLLDACYEPGTGYEDGTNRDLFAIENGVDTGWLVSREIRSLRRV